MPFTWTVWEYLYHTQNNFPVLSHGCNIDTRLLSKEDFLLVYGNYNWPSDRFYEILDKYHVRYIVSDRRSIDTYIKEILKEPDLFSKRATLLFESSNMVCYEAK